MRMDKFGLIGESLGHSFSKVFFNHYFAERKIQASYDNIELLRIQDIIEVFQKDYSGFNVTIPYKETIIPYLTEIDQVAKNIGAVNVVAVIGDKKIGYNTDAYGFQQSIKPFLSNKHERCMIFGTGGASKAISYVLKTLGIDVIFISRNPKLKNEFSYDKINENMINACKLLVNCTPVGTFPNIDDQIDIPYRFLTESHLVVDLIYNPQKTMFLERSEEKGAMILNGESMLRHQALKSWEIWNQ